MAKQKLRPSEIAELWGVSVDTVLTWIHTGELSAIDARGMTSVGKPRYLVDRLDLAAFEQQRRMPEVATPRISGDGRS